MLCATSNNFRFVRIRFTIALVLGFLIFNRAFWVTILNIYDFSFSLISYDMKQILRATSPLPSDNAFEVRALFILLNY